MRVNMPVHVEWVGHACFRIRRDGGPTIVTDPYTQRNVSLPEDTTIEGDTVIVSSLTDRAHGNPKLVRGNPRVINALDLAVSGTEAQVEGSPLITLKVRESDTHESGSPKDNAMYALKVGGLWLLHMGDLGYGLSGQEMAPFVGRCDLLLALVGQTNTIPLKDLDFLIDHLKPKWIVPMHYLLWWPSKMRPLGEFLAPRVWRFESKFEAEAEEAKGSRGSIKQGGGKRATEFLRLVVWLGGGGEAGETS